MAIYMSPPLSRFGWLSYSIAGKYGVKFSRVVNERRFIEWVDGGWRLRANSHTTITPLLSTRLQTARLVYFLLSVKWRCGIRVLLPTYSVRVWVQSSVLVSPWRVRFMSTSLPPRSPNGRLTYSRCTAYSPSWDHSFFANTAYSRAATHTLALLLHYYCIIIALLHCQQLLLSTIEHKPLSTFIYFQSTLWKYLRIVRPFLP
jgi:hypothetical protein